MANRNIHSKKDPIFVIHVTPDQGWAWIISLSCAAINGITFGLVRSYGVLFVNLLKYYEVSRETASWPFSLCTSFTHLSGPVSSILITYFTMRTIVSVGSLLAAVGIILCYFANSVTEITIYIGIIQGFGIGLTFMQTPVILAQYFTRFRATATAIAYAGGTIGSFLFPPILEYTLDEYGLHGCFLIIGAILLNALPFAFLLRPATPGQKFNRHLSRVSRQLSIKPDIKTGFFNCTTRKESDPYQESRNSSLTSQQIPNCALHSRDNSNHFVKPHNEMTMSLIEIQNQIEKKLTKLHTSQNYLTGYKCVCDAKQKYYEDESADYKLNEKACQTDHQEMSIFRKKLNEFYSVIINPLYIILSVTHVSFQWAWMTYQMVIIDFAIDRGISENKSIILLSSFAIADLFGRLTSGLVADRKLVKKRYVVSVCILLIGVLIFLTPVATSFRILLMLTIALGFVCGAIIVLFSILTMEYVGLDRLPVALGFSAFVVGSSTLIRPIVVGYFRDTFGSYDGLFQFVGLVAFLSALFWLSEPFARLWVNRNRKYSYGVKAIVV